MDNELPVETPVEGPVLFKFTNQVESGQLDNLLAMFYMGCGANKIGIMTAWNVVTQQEEIILVGVEFDDEGKTDLYPLARMLSVEDTRNYLAPNGKGEYYDLQDATEVAEAKEGMRSYSEAVVQ